MANNCINTIVFSGENLSPIRDIIKDIKEMDLEGYGWIPEGYESSNNHCLFDVEVDDNGDEIIFNCWSKWTPPIDEIYFLCSNVKVDFIMLYEELGMNVYGRCSFDSKTNTFEDIHLTDEDFERLQEDDDTFEFTFDGEPIGCRYYAYDEMLENKLKQSN